NTTNSLCSPEPTRAPCLDAPTACDASSTTAKPYFPASAWMRSMSGACPAKCTGMTTFGVFFARLSFSSSASADMLYVRRSVSTKSTDAPQYSAQLAEATKELGAVQTTSPEPTSSAIIATCSADVALFSAD